MKKLTAKQIVSVLMKNPLPAAEQTFREGGPRAVKSKQLLALAHDDDLGKYQTARAEPKQYATGGTATMCPNCFQKYVIDALADVDGETCHSKR